MSTPARRSAIPIISRSSQTRTLQKHGSRKTIPKASHLSMRFLSEPDRPAHDHVHAADRGLGRDMEPTPALTHDEASNTPSFFCESCRGDLKNAAKNYYRRWRGLRSDLRRLDQSDECLPAAALGPSWHGHFYRLLVNCPVDCR